MHIVFAKVRKFHHNLTGVGFQWIIVAVNMSFQIDDQVWHFVYQIQEELFGNSRHGVVIS